MNTFNALSLALQPIASADTSDSTASTSSTRSTRQNQKTHEPLYRATEAAASRGTRRSGAVELRTAIRLAALSALIGVGIGLGHGITANASPVSQAPVAPSASASSYQLVVSAFQAPAAR